MDTQVLAKFNIKFKDIDKEILNNVGHTFEYWINV